MGIKWKWEEGCEWAEGGCSHSYLKYIGCISDRCVRFIRGQSVSEENGVRGWGEAGGG